MDLGKGRTLLGPPPGHAILEWQPGRSTWVISGARDDIKIAVNGRVLSPGAGFPLGHLDVVTVDSLNLRFHKTPAMPLLNGVSTNEVMLSDRKLVIGRDERGGGTGQVNPGEDRWLLDFEDLGISKQHAEVTWDIEEGYVLHDRSKTGTYLNGAAFERKVLVVGDRFSVGDYFFEFTGTSVCCVDKSSGARVEGHNLTLEVPREGGRAEILKHVSIEVKGGEFLGVLGGSGQGKSTLMNILAGLVEPTSGHVMVDGTTVGSFDLEAGGIGFVPQDDIVHSELTVRQALTFTAQLRLAVPDEALKTLIEGTIRRLGLEKQKDQPIRLLSGGQRKRVNIATELLARPPVLFLDEPTSGLDPANEESVITALQNLRLTGQTVVCTTHGLHKAYLFDRIAFVHDGRLMFLGTTGEARRHFLEMEEVAINETMGPLVKLERIYSLFGRQADAVEWEKKFSESSLAPFRPDAPPPPRRVVTTQRQRQHPGLIKTLTVLLKTQLAILLSDPKNWKSLLAQALGIGVLAGWVGRDDPEFRFFACLIASLWFGCSNAAQTITRELPIFRRERVAGLGLHPYILSKTLFLSAISWMQVALLLVAQALPVLISGSVKVGTLLVGGKVLPYFDPCRDLFPSTLEGMTLFLAAYALSGVVGVMFGLSLSAHARTTTQASLWVPLVLIPQILFSGFVVTLPEMPASSRLFSHLVPSANAQRLLDAGNVASQPVPLMTDKTRIPMFWWTNFTTAPEPGKDWTSTGQEIKSFEITKRDDTPTKDNYREIDEYNSAWQNLAVTHSKTGEVLIAPTGVKPEDHALSERTDVLNGEQRWRAGQRFDATGTASTSVLALLCWIALCYAIIWLGLIYAEPETLRPQWARRVRVQ